MDFMFAQLYIFPEHTQNIPVQISPILNFSHDFYLCEDKMLKGECNRGTKQKSFGIAWLVIFQ
jgi:hypothetical protein